MLGNYELMSFVTPAYNAFHKFSMALCILPIISIFLHKFNLMKQLDDKKNMILEWVKVFFLLFIIFNWLTVSTLFLKAGDALEAVFLNKVDIVELYDVPSHYENKTLKTVLKELLKFYRLNSISEDKLENKLSKMNQVSYNKHGISQGSEISRQEEKVNKLKQDLNDVKNGLQGFWSKYFAQDSVKEATEKLEKKLELEEKTLTELQNEQETLTFILGQKSKQQSSTENTLNLEDPSSKDGVLTYAVRSGLSFLVIEIGFLSRVVMGTLRDAFIIIFILLGPLLIAYSYLSILGDQQDQNGLNKRSTTFINIFILLIFFPFLYAVLDQVILLLLIMANQLQLLSTLSEVLGFFLFYLVMNVSFPFFIYSLNPMGVINGVFSSLSSLQISASMMGLSSVSRAAGMGVNLGKNTASSMFNNSAAIGSQLPDINKGE